MRATNLSKIDLLFCISMMLAVVIALYIGPKLLIENNISSIETKTNATTIHVYKDKRQAINAAGGGHSGHDGHDGDDHRPGYPFLWYFEKIVIPEVTVKNSVNEELKRFAQLTVNSPSMAAKEHQIENDLVLSSEVSAFMKTQVKQYCNPF